VGFCVSEKAVVIGRFNEAGVPEANGVLPSWVGVAPEATPPTTVVGTGRRTMRQSSIYSLRKICAESWVAAPTLMIQFRQSTRLPSTIELQAQEGAGVQVAALDAFEHWL